MAVQTQTRTQTQARSKDRVSDRLIRRQAAAAGGELKQDKSLLQKVRDGEADVSSSEEWLVLTVLAELLG